MHKRVSTDYQDELILLSSAEVTGEDVPTRLLIAPWGSVESVKGDFVVDEAAVNEVISAFRQHGADLPIDFEHQTLGGEYASPAGLAPAAGWIKSLEGVAGVGLMADVGWTELGREQLQARFYRYLSPVAVIRQSDRRMISLHSAALTNKPAIVGMEAIVNSEKVSEFASGSTGQGDVQVIATGGDEISSSLDQLRQLLDCSAEASANEVLMLAASWIRLHQIRQLEQQAEDRVLRAMASGKLTESQRAWAKQLAMKDVQSFENYLQNAPVMVNVGKSREPADTKKVTNLQRSRMVQARHEYRSYPVLKSITSEEAYVRMALSEQ